MITATRTSGNPIDNFMFSASNTVNMITTNAVIDRADTDPFEVNDTEVLRIDGDVRTTYDWRFSGDVRGSGTAVASPSTQTSAEFLTRAVAAIQADQIPGLENWQSAYVPSPSPGGLRLISDDAGVRTLSGFEFTTTTTRASTIRWNGV